MSKILVGIIANDWGRSSLFASCVTMLDTTDLDVTVEWVIGGDWCSARNQLAQLSIDEGYQYLWFMDDDHAFAPDLLKRLVATQKLVGNEIINPVCLARIAPFPLVTYERKLDDGSAYLPLDIEHHGPADVVQLEAGGAAGMLIPTGVFRRMPGPWFEYSDRSEDILFCEKAKACGFGIYADLGARLGHITTAVVWPAINEGQWVTGITVGRDMDLQVPLAQHWVQEQPPADSDPPTLASPPFAGVERVEIWYDIEDNRWHGREVSVSGALGEALESRVREDTIVLDIQAKYGVEMTIHQIPGPEHDSRNLRYDQPPRRRWGGRPE